jgi:hypothetical protein
VSRAATVKSARARIDSFTIARRFLTEAKQYLIALTSTIGAVVALKAIIGKLNLADWPLFCVMAIPPFLVFLYKTLPRWREQRRQDLLVKVSQQVDAEPPGRRATPDEDYFVIGPYAEDRYQRYRRADAVHEKILRWVRETREQILILSGSSGTGKSSLLQAFVIPYLREDNPPCTVLLVRGFDEPIAELCRQLAIPGIIWEIPADDLGTLSWRQLLDRSIARIRRKNQAAQLVVVFDQFEELVILQADGSPGVAAIRDFLQGIRQRPPEGFTLILCVRSEYKSFLEPLGAPPLGPTNWREVPAFLRTDAAAFLTAQESHLTISAGRLRRIMDEAAAVDGARGLIRPITLNMLGCLLRRMADSPEAERPSVALLADDLRAVIEEPSWRTVAHAILPHMLSEAYTKRPRTIGDLQSETHLDPHVINGCLLDLALFGYVRLVYRPPEITARVWEVSHDFVARLLGPILKTPLRAFWQRALSVVYPLSLGICLLASFAGLLFAPKAARFFAEENLRRRGFSVYQDGNITNVWYVPEQGKSLTDESLAAAVPFLAHFNRLKLTIRDPRGERSQDY